MRHPVVPAGEFTKGFQDFKWNFFTGSPARLKPLLPYALALTSSGLAFVVSNLAGHYFQNAPYVLYYPAVFISAACGGGVGGLLATFLTAFLAAAGSNPHGEGFSLSADDLIPTATYMVICLITITLLGRAQHAAAERAQAEKELQELNRELESRVAQRTAAWEQANHDLEDFAHSISHDLRTPLRAIEGFARIIRDEASLDPKSNEYLQHICSNASRMTQMINDLLAFSKFSRKPMAKTVVDMKALAESVGQELLALEPSRRVHLKILDLPQASGDVALLRQVLTNLISNGLKFTRLASEAFIEIGGRSESAFTLYYVQDNGVGFDQAYAHKLFKVFQRLHKPEEFEGTGVGLSIVHRIVQRHGGRVWAEGRKNQGARFSFTLCNQPTAELEPFSTSHLHTQLLPHGLEKSSLLVQPQAAEAQLISVS